MGKGKGQGKGKGGTVEISAEILEQKATKSTKRFLQALASWQFALLPDCSGAETLTGNKALPQTEMWHSHLSDLHLLLGARNRYKGTRAAVSSILAFPAMLHHLMGCTTLFSVPTGTDSCSLPRWQKQDSCFTTAIPQCPSGTVTPRAHQASATRHPAKQANQPKHRWH